MARGFFIFRVKGVYAHFFLLFVVLEIKIRQTGATDFSAKFSGYPNNMQQIYH